MDDNFRNEYGEIVNKALLGVNDYYFSHIEELSDAFRESLQAACMQVKQMQKQGYPDVEYMEVTMLRTRFIQHDYRVPILVYGSDWYADLGQAQAGEIDAGGIFSFFEEMIQAAAAPAKKYRTKLSERVLDYCMCLTAEYFWKYVNMACKRAVMGLTLEGMGLTPEFRVRVCEYMGYGWVCRRFTPFMEPKEMKEWFDKKEKDVYRFRDFGGLDFSGWDFSGLDLTGCDFSGCNLGGCNFGSTDLTGTWFCGSSMKNVCFNEAWIPGARFDRADLRESVLEGTRSSCKINGDSWGRPDLEPASFKDCCLKNADFTFSAIECADFSGADMEGAVFNDAHRDYYGMDGQQREQVRFCGY